MVLLCFALPEGRVCDAIAYGRHGSKNKMAYLRGKVPFFAFLGRKIMSSFVLCLYWMLRSSREDPRDGPASPGLRYSFAFPPSFVL